MGGADADTRATALQAISQIKRKKMTPSVISTEPAISPRPVDLSEWYVRDSHNTSVLNHEPRSHMASDLVRYLFCSSFGKAHGRSPKLGDFPAELLPDHKNLLQGTAAAPFTDRFRVQLADHPSSTVTSHISKDGHYYIHHDPSQCRSLSVREAARLQTFPDDYLFEGNRTQQYHQVGNAVPPWLAKQIAEIVVELFRDSSATRPE